MDTSCLDTNYLMENTTIRMGKTRIDKYEMRRAAVVREDLSRQTRSIWNDETAVVIFEIEINSSKVRQYDERRTCRGMGVGRGLCRLSQPHHHQSCWMKRCGQ